MAEPSWTASSTVSVSGPAGWSAVERVEVMHRSGRAMVRVERYPVAPGADLDALAALHGAGVVMGEWTDSGLAPGPVLGSADGRHRTVGWADPDGNAMSAALQYALRPGALLVLTTVMPEGDPALAAEAALVGESLRLREPVAMTDETLPLRPAEVDFSEVAEAWCNGTSPEVRPEHVVTAEESFSAAAHFGVAMFPGADTGIWERLDAAQRDLVAGVAWRSLVARGADADTDLAEALQLAASHDLIVMVSEQHGDESRSQWFAARADRMVRLRPALPGQVSLTTHRTADLADLVLADASGPGVVVTASAVYRSGGHVTGDETRWTGDESVDVVREALAGLVSGSRARSAP